MKEKFAGFEEIRNIALCRLLGVLARIDIDSKNSQRYLSHFNKALGRLLGFKSDNNSPQFELKCQKPECGACFRATIVDNNIELHGCNDPDHGQSNHNCCKAQSALIKRFFT